uniref:Terpene synthase N-terminal domain-containing protein n=1 Tax=Leersia perrieri TaxID=77586 RepID=A0A0D9W3K1_9ORYZ
MQGSEECMRQMADKLKKNVRTLFWTSNDVVARMNLVDAIQRLGISHLFENEISSTLSDIHKNDFTSSSLQDIALRFRLLREHGLWVSPDVFNNFKDDDRRFINGVANDPRGLLSLYNAAYLLVHDEPELEEAISFSRHHLKSMIQGSVLKHPLVDQVQRALHLPLPRTYKRAETLHYFLEYGQEEGHNSILLDLAKLDFNILQGVHLKELKAVSEWDENSIPLLPEYLKNFYSKLLNNFKEFEDQVAVNEKYRVSYAKMEFQKLSHYYLEEAEWLHQNHKPSFQEQVALSTKTPGAQLVCVSTAIGRGDVFTKEAFEWTTRSDAIKACAKIMRFMNDIASFKRGKNKGDIASTVECYMNEHKVTSEAAFTELSLLIEDEWRTMNEALFEHHELLPAVQRVVNLAISIMFLYDKRKDAYTFSSHLQEIVKSLFVKPVPM